MDNLDNISTFLKIINDDEYKEKINELNSKIQELKSLIGAEGGVNKINQLLSEATSKATIANTLLLEARDKAVEIVEDANIKAEEIFNTAKERAAQMKELTESKFVSANQKEGELKKLQVVLDKAKSKLEKEQKYFIKTQAELLNREQSIEKTEVIIAQLHKSIDE